MWRPKFILEYESTQFTTLVIKTSLARKTSSFATYSKVTG